jgi:hypothetical protein
VVRECRLFGYAGGCPVGESVADRLITLPNYAALTGQDIDHVAEVFLSDLLAWRSDPKRSRAAQRKGTGSEYDGELLKRCT